MSDSRLGKQVYRSTSIQICGHTHEEVAVGHLREERSVSCLHSEVEMISSRRFASYTLLHLAPQNAACAYCMYREKVTTMYHTNCITKYTMKTSSKHVLMVVAIVHYTAPSIPSVIGQQETNCLCLLNKLAAVYFHKC